MAKIVFVVLLMFVALFVFGAAGIHLLGHDIVHLVHTFLDSASNGASS